MDPKISSSLASGVLIAVTAALAGACKSEDAPLPSTPEVTCTLDRECLALTHNAGATSFGLRVVHIEIDQPASFTGLMDVMMDSSFTPDILECGAYGYDRSSWLLSFDLVAGTLALGGFDPPEDPSQGVSFLNTVMTQTGKSFPIQPVTYPLELGADGTFTVIEGQDVNLPVHLTFWGETSLSMLPLRALRVVDAALSASHDCVGHLQPEDPDDGDVFSNGGELDGFLTLEDADAVEVTGFRMSLCAAISGDIAKWGDSGMPINRCKRTNGVIDLHGDWCSATNAPADEGCFDSMKFRASFAASAVPIKD
jgi:hypothetical protein